MLNVKLYHQEFQSHYQKYTKIYEVEIFKDYMKSSIR